MDSKMKEAQSEEEFDSKDKAPENYKPDAAGGKRKRKLTSQVYITFLPVNQDGVLECKCKKCGKIYNADSKYGTGHLQRHIKKCEKISTTEIGQLILQNNAGTLANRSPRFNSEIFREIVALAIVEHDLPFQFAEYSGIRHAFSYLCPDVKFFSRNTTRSDVMMIFKREKEKLKDILMSIPGRIALTSDCWTSINTDGYISLTAHFIDNDWQLRKRILNFSFLPPPHNGVALTQKLFDLLNAWGIKKKVMAITLDNASANDMCVGLLKYQLSLLCGGEYLHNRCCAHILNLIVQEGLKVVDVAVEKVRESIKYCKGSQSRKQKFLDYVSMVNLDPTRGLRQDVPTRWNSTYLMLGSAIYYRKAFEHLKFCESNYVHCPSSEEWDKIEKLHQFLAVFYEVTCEFSGVKYPTTNLYFPNVVRVRLLLKEEMEKRDSEDNSLKVMAAKMFKNFEKYWVDFNSLMAIAGILGPRYKFQLVDYAFSKIYGDGYSTELLVLKGQLLRLFDEYKKCGVLCLSSNNGVSSSASCNFANVPNDHMTSNTFLKDLTIILAMSLWLLL